MKTLPRFSFFSCRFLWRLLITAGLLFPPVHCALADTGNDSDSITGYTPLKHTYTAECAYKDEAALEINYRLRSTAQADLVIRGSAAGSGPVELVRKVVDRGDGNVTLTFQAGECLQTIAITLE